MNVSRLLDVLEILQQYEKQYKIQNLLNDVNSQLANLASQPSNPPFQTAYDESLQKLDAGIAKMLRQFEPRETTVLSELNGMEFYSDDISASIRAWVAQNPASPAVAQQKLADFIARRLTFTERVDQLAQNLTAVGITVDTLDEGQAEIGFLLPRALFRNQLVPLIEELRAINRIIRAFSEAATGSAEEIEVREITASDPLFFFGLDPLTIATIGGAITWALATWKQVEEIRKLRAETEKIQSFTKMEIDKFYGSKIEAVIRAAIQEQTEVVLAAVANDNPRKNEQRTDIAWALESVMSRIERGMTVEIRMIPPPRSKDDEGKEEPLPEAFETLERVIPEMVFPSIQGSPVLALPPNEPPEKAEAKKK